MFYKWSFLFVICALPTFGRDYRQEKNDLLRLEEEKISIFKLRLHKKLQELINLRNSLMAGEQKLQQSVSSNLVVMEGTGNVTKGCIVHVEGRDVVFVVTSDNTLWILKNVTLEPIRSFPSYRVFLSLQGVGNGVTAWLIAQHTGKRTRHFVNVYAFESMTLKESQRLDLDGFGLVAATKSDNRFYVAIISESDVLPEFRLYHWIGTQFDEIFWTQMNTVYSALALWNIDGIVYIGMSSVDTERLMIQRFVEHSGKMSNIQFLDFHAHVIKVFQDAGSHHYLVCANQSSLMIYWWTGSGFQQMQSTNAFPQNIVDIAVHRISDSVMIAVAFQHEVVFFVQDSSSHYVKAGSQRFGPSKNLKSVLLWKNGNNLNMLPIFEGNHSMSMYKIDLEFEVSEPEKENTLEGCMKKLGSYLNKREEKIVEINHIVENTWSPSTSRQFSSFKVNGTVKSLSNSTIRSLNLDMNVSTPSSLEEKNVELIDCTQVLSTKITKSVLKSKEQHIQSDLNFTNLAVGHGEVNKLFNHVYINRVVTNRLPYALKKKGQQIFPYETMVVNVKCQAATTDFLNENRVEDYVLLRDGPWRLNGYMTFKNVSARKVFVMKTINDVNVTEIVLTSKVQNIHGQKIFENLTADSVQTTEKNIHLDEIKGIVYLDSKNFGSFLTIIPPLNIKGNLNVSLLNGNEISRLYSKSIRKNERGNIDGFKTMKSVVIKGNVTILEGINRDYQSVIFDNLMTVKTDQNISGDIAFSSIAHHGDILTDSLNEIDLSSEAVVKAESSSNIEIKGVKTFQKNLSVSGIVMKEEVLIDFFDPSAEISEIMYKVDNSNVAITHWFNNSVTIGGGVANDVEVDKDNFKFLKGLENVWLKTTEQNISNTEVNTMAVGSLQVSSVNGATVEDLVTVNGNSNINATIEFTEVVSTQTLNFQKGANLTYSSGFWNPDILLKVSGNIITEDATIEGNLNITGAIENIEMDLMQAQKMQTVEGKVQFAKIELKELDSIDLNFDTLKLKSQKINITEYYERSVLLSKVIRVFNKTFATLKGSMMECKGTLNNFSLEKVVTTDTKQKLESSYTFQNFAHFNKKVNVTKFFGGIQLENVIYTDSNRSISNKDFNGTVTTSRLATTGNVSGVNITRLQLEALNKTVDSNVTKKVTFHGNLEAKEIQVTENNTIDDIDLKSLIKLNETVTLGDCEASSIAAENVTVKGYINGCDLESVYENALLLTQGTQNITGKVHVGTLDIHGNLNVEFLNEADILEWTFRLLHMEKSEMGTDLIFETLKADNINILKTVNNIDVNFIMNDCVQKNHPQEIIGKKRFQEIEVKNVTIDVMNSDKTCGIDLLQIYKLAINRSTGSEILLLSNLTVAGLEAKNLTVAGKLNNLTLPNDVVLSNASEIIENELKIDSFNASQGLDVSGKIDNVRLKEFLEERATLNASENISSILIFKDDASITENFSVNGTINEIRLEDIVKVFQSQTISGTKNFAGKLEVESAVIVNGSVNDILLDHLQKSLYKDSRNESVKDLVKFSSLSTSSLICGTVNGVHMVDFYNHTRVWGHDVEDKLYDFTSVIKSHEELLWKQRESMEHPLSLYSAFELHKILNFQSIERFLPVYEYGTYGPKYDLEVTQMIMWVKNVGDPCRKMKSLVADVMRNGTFNITNEMRGKIFPFSLHVAKENIVGFYVQVEHAKKCSVGKKPHIVVKTVYSSGVREKKIIVSPIFAAVLDVQLLEVNEDEIYLIISYSNAGSSERIFVYQYDAVDHAWSIFQTFHFQDLTSISIISLEPHTNSPFENPSVYLSVTGDDSSPGITVYEWVFDLHEFVLKTNISASISTHALWVENDNTLYLLLAKEMSRIWKDNAWVKSFTEPLEVYTIEEDELILNHTVNVEGVSSLEAFGLADETFVLASSNHKGTVYVLQYRGFNGFELIQEIPSPGVTEALVFTVDKHLYLALNSKAGPSRILKTSIRGGIQDLE